MCSNCSECCQKGRKHSGDNDTDSEGDPEADVSGEQVKCVQPEERVLQALLSLMQLFVEGWR